MENEHREPTMKEELGEITEEIVLTRFAERYFPGHKRAWFTHKMSGAVVGTGKRYPQRFTQEERTQLKYALQDLANRIYQASERI